MRRIIFAFVLALSSFGFADTNIENEQQKLKPPIPTGTWTYNVYSGKIKIGSATTTILFLSGIITSTTETTLKKDETIVITKEITKESSDFKPISLFASNIVILKNSVDRETVNADFNNGIIKLKLGNVEKNLTIKEDFIISGNCLTAGLLKSRFLKGFESKFLIYNPQFEEENPVSISETVIGKELVNLPQGKVELYHTIETVGTIKNIHNYIDSEGTIYKTTIPATDGAIDFILESHKADTNKQ